MNIDTVWTDLALTTYVEVYNHNKIKYRKYVL
jgi:hypothetical protein